MEPTPPSVPGLIFRIRREGSFARPRKPERLFAPPAWKSGSSLAMAHAERRRQKNSCNFLR
jgi:hypothetical protein